MTKLKLGPLPDDKPVKLTVELPAAHFADGERRFQAIVSSCFARW